MSDTSGVGTPGTPAEIGKQLFSMPCKPPNSFQLITEEADSEYVFQILLNIFLEGLIVRGHVDLLSESKVELLPKDLKVIQEYMQSVCFNVEVETKPMTEDEDTDYYCQIVPLLLNDEVVFRHLLNDDFNSEEEDWSSFEHLNKYVAIFPSVMDVNGEKVQICHYISFTYLTQL